MLIINERIRQLQKVIVALMRGRVYIELNERLKKENLQCAEYVEKLNFTYIGGGREVFAFKDNLENRVVKIFHGNVIYTKSQLNISFYLHKIYEILFADHHANIRSIFYNAKGLGVILIQDYIEPSEGPYIWDNFEKNVSHFIKGYDLPSLVDDLFANFVRSEKGCNVYVDLYGIEFKYEFYQLRNLPNIISYAQMLLNQGKLDEADLSGIQRYIRRIEYYKNKVDENNLKTA